MPITARAQEEVRPAVEADGVRIQAIGSDEPQDLPAAGDLSDWMWDQYRLESGIAGKLGFTVGSIEASRNARTLVAEFSRSKTVATGETIAWFGVAARLVVNVSGLEARANLALPFVAAEAQFNCAEAYASLRVEGYVGPEVLEVLLPGINNETQRLLLLLLGLGTPRVYPRRGRRPQPVRILRVAATPRK